MYTVPMVIRTPYGGGIRVGHPFLVDQTGIALEYADAHNENIRLYRNQVIENGGQGGVGVHPRETQLVAEEAAIEQDVVQDAEEDRERQEAVDLVHVEQCLEARRTALAAHPGDVLVQQQGDEEHALVVAEMGDREDRAGTHNVVTFGSSGIQ